MSDGNAGVALARRETFKRGSETQLTYRLKWSAWEWLYVVVQCRCIGVEVRLEGPGGRVVDLVAVGPGNAIYVVEVKASRADFSRDNHTPNDLAALKAQAKAVSGRTELARGTLAQATAYAQRERPDTWREVFAYRQALADYHRMVRREKTYKTRLATFSIKFHDDRFLNIADYHYIIAPAGVISRRTLPLQWGLLDDTPAVVVPAPLKTVRKNTGIVSNVLRAIARSSTTSMMHALGVLFTEDGPVFPNRVSTCDSKDGGDHGRRHD